MKDRRIRIERAGYVGRAARLWAGAVLLLLQGAGPVRAQAGGPGTNLTLGAAVELALRDNPGLRTLREKWGAMQERPAQSGALPNPMFTYSGMDPAGGGSWPNTGEKRFMLEQPVPGFGKRALREGIAARDADAMRGEMNAMALDVAMMVKESYFDLCAVRQVISLAREEEDIARRLVRGAEAMYATGARTQSDLAKAQAEQTMLRQKLLDLQAQEATLTARLNTLLNRGAAEPLSLAAPPPDAVFGGDVAALAALAATNRPEVQAAQAQVERYTLERRLMAKEFRPDYRYGVEYRDIGNGEDMVMFTVGVDLPVWRAKNRAGVREAEKMRASSLAALESAERQSAADVQAAASGLRAATRTLELYRRELVPRAEARLGASRAGYRTGRVDFMDLLDSERALLGTKMMAAMAEGAAGMQLARLERAAGLAAAGGKGSQHDN